MIQKGSDYEQTAEFGSGFKTLPKGGYVCKIAKAEETTDKNGRVMVHLAFDIAEGEYQGYFMNLFQTRKKKAQAQFGDVKWPFEGQSWIGVNDYEDPTKTSRNFKGLCTALEDSGIQVWNGNQFNMQALAGASVGVVYQNQEKEYQGKRYWRSVPWSFRSVEAIRTDDYFVPDDKPLADTASSGSASTGYQPSGIPGFQAVTDNDIPF